MNKILLTLLLLGSTLAPSYSQIVMGPTEPPEYAKGVYCTPHGDNVFGVQTTDHPCACKNMLREDKDGCCEVPVNNDDACKQWCHEDHCSCPKICIPGKPDETETPHAGEPTR